MDNWGDTEQDPQWASTAPAWDKGIAQQRFQFTRFQLTASDEQGL